jgi:ABC-type branched-subunit amino acid transport system ATPase component
VLLAESEHHRVEALADRVYVIERGEVQGKSDGKNHAGR